MKKILALVLALCMVFALCACGQEEVTQAAQDAANAVAENAAEIAEAVSEVEAAVADATEVESIKVGMVTDVGGVNDQSFNQSAWEGLKALGEENSAVEVAYLESKTDADYSSNIQTFLDEDYDLIICVGYMLADATREAAEANPDQMFAIIDDATNADLDNVACLMFSQEQASYLVGVAAGTMTETGTVGYVQGMVSDTMHLFGLGYIAGVLSVNPDATVLQQNANSFADSASGSAIATDMFSKGADIIYHAAGGTGAGVISACADNGIYAIGVDSDQNYLAPETVITSAMKRVDIASQDISLAVLSGEFTGGVHQYDLSNGGVDIAPTTDLLTEDALAAVEAAKAAILDGSVVVPTTTDEVPEFTLS